MKFLTAIEQVRRYKYYITYAEFGEKLGLTLEAVKKRIQRKSDLKYDETFMLAKGFNLPVKLFFQAEDIPHTLPIEYYENNKIRLERNENMMKYYMDFEIAYKYNRRFDKDDFAIICMRDNIDFGPMWCHEGDVLLLDVTKNEISAPGFYAYECDGGSYVAMAYIERGIDRKFHFRKNMNPDDEEVRTEVQLSEVRFKVIGRIIKNLMFFS